jgi:aerobic-type carbon monoxide dehydrogenase small subunit (CoxS/CutS family)
MSRHDVEVTVNGERRRGSVEARKTLADFLRDDCSSTGGRFDRVWCSPSRPGVTR